MAYIVETCSKCGKQNLVKIPFDNDSQKENIVEEQDERCAYCKHWYSYEMEKNPGSPSMWTDGSCHRYPPSIPCVSGMTDVKTIIFEEPYKGLLLVDHPVTFGDNWCGEFTRR